MHMKRLFLLLAVIFISGCIGGQTAKVDINNGVVIDKFTADPKDVFDFQTVTFTADLSNVGGTTADDVTLRLLGVENAWRQQGGSGTVSEVTKGPFQLKPPNLKDNIPGGSRFFDITLTAPDLNEGDKATFPVKARAEFSYSTTGSIIVKILSVNQNRILSDKGQTILDAVKESNSEGPVKFKFVRGSTPLVIDPDESATIERDFRFEISNVGAGYPITDNTVGKVGGSSRGSRIRLQAPSGITLKSCDGTTGTSESFSANLRSDGKAPISCTVSINTADWRTKSEGSLIFNVELNYKYFVDSEVSVNIQGTKQGDISRPAGAPVGPSGVGATPVPGATPGPPVVLPPTTPASGATSSDLRPTIIVTFNKPLDANSIANSIIVTGPDGTVAGSTAQGGGNGENAVFIPNTVLRADATYTVTVLASIKSRDGFNLANPYTFTFKTPASDTTPPTLTLGSPALEALVNSRTVTLSMSTNEAATCRILATGETLSSIDGRAHQLTKTNLADGQQTFTIRCKDAAGNENVAANDLIFRFTVDATAPTVATIVPTNAATAVSKTPDITITFSEKMNKATVASAFSLKAGSTAIAVGSPLWSADDLSVTLRPSAALAGSTEHTVTLSTDAKDLAGNPLASAFTSKFTTAA